MSVLGTDGTRRMPSCTTGSASGSTLSPTRASGSLGKAPTSDKLTSEKSARESKCHNYHASGTSASCVCDDVHSGADRVSAGTRSKGVEFGASPEPPSKRGALKPGGGVTTRRGSDESGDRVGVASPACQDPRAARLAVFRATPEPEIDAVASILIEWNPPRRPSGCVRWLGATGLQGV